MVMLSWRPTNAYEYSIFLEDDVEVSAHYFKWILAAFRVHLFDVQAAIAAPESFDATAMWPVLFRSKAAAGLAGVSLYTPRWNEVKHPGEYWDPYALLNDPASKEASCADQAADVGSAPGAISTAAAAEVLHRGAEQGSADAAAAALCNEIPILRERWYPASTFLMQLPCSWGALYLPWWWRTFSLYYQWRHQSQCFKNSHKTTVNLKGGPPDPVKESRRDVLVPGSRTNRWHKSWKK